jgi:hypothetical protein
MGFRYFLAEQTVVRMDEAGNIEVVFDDVWEPVTDRSWVTDERSVEISETRAEVLLSGWRLRPRAPATSIAE